MAEKPGVWGGLYIITIPLAAFAFLLCGSGFIDVNLAREGSTLHDEARLATVLTSALDRNAARFNKRHSRQQFRFLSAPTVETVERGAGPTGSLAADVYLSFGSEQEETIGNVWFQLGPQEGSVKLGKAPMMYLYSVQPVGPGGSGSEYLAGPMTRVPGALFPALSGGAAATLSVAPTTNRKFIDLIGALAGDPSDASGPYWRMLYVSATTITTLGLGDIQPVTTPARICLAAEAVLGILFAGMFLNAITRPWRRGEGRQPRG